MAMNYDIKWRDAIIRVLDEAKKSMHYTEITEQILERGLRGSKVGATPANTVATAICDDINRNKDKSVFVRTGSGEYILRKHLDFHEIKVAETSPEKPAIISSFAMFWRRDAVVWSATPKLLGMQQLNAAPVDFNEQLGLYLLYDGREVIYVGRTTDRPLGRRLYEHTRDRFSARWDRFSWFGVLPVSDNGMLGKMPPTIQSDLLVPALEAILIEALEPRQNRKRGDDLSAVEYIQKEDPEIQKKRIKAALEELR